MWPRAAHRARSAPRRLPKPVIAAVHGHAWRRAHRLSPPATSGCVTRTRVSCASEDSDRGRRGTLQRLPGSGPCVVRDGALRRDLGATRAGRAGGERGAPDVSPPPRPPGAGGAARAQLAMRAGTSACCATRGQEVEDACATSHLNAAFWRAKPQGGHDAFFQKREPASTAASARVPAPEQATRASIDEGRVCGRSHRAPLTRSQPWRPSTRRAWRRAATDQIRSSRTR